MVSDLHTVVAAAAVASAAFQHHSDKACRADKLFVTVGCHPTHCNEFAQFKAGPDAYERALEDLIAQHRVGSGGAGSAGSAGSAVGGISGKVVAVGETGLDYDREHFCKREVQRPYFERQLALAERTKLPLFLHTRNCSADFLAIMHAHRGRLPGGGVVHSFSDELDTALALVDMGFYIGINGCSLKTQENLEIVRQIPLDKLMLEVR